MGSSQQAAAFKFRRCGQFQKVAPPQIWILRNPPHPQKFSQVSHNGVEPL